MCNEDDLLPISALQHFISSKTFKIFIKRIAVNIFLPSRAPVAAGAP